MKASSLAALSIFLTVACDYSLAHDDASTKEKEFTYAYQLGYLTAVRDAGEGTSMCTRNVKLLELIKAIGDYNKSKGIAPEDARTFERITSALSQKFPCRGKLE